MNILRRSIANLLIASTALMGLPMTAWADIIPTEEVVSAATSTVNRDRVVNFLNRADVRQGLQAHGLDAELALQRVNAMSDPEVAQLAGRIDQAPAGGEILGLLFTVFVILLVTDILGLTKVFTFTRSVRH